MPPLKRYQLAIEAKQEYITTLCKERQQGYIPGQGCQ